MTTGKFNLLVVLLIGLAFHAVADVYKCKTANGKTLFSSTPCDQESKTVSVHRAEYIPEDQRQAAIADVNRQKAFVANKERERSTVFIAPSGPAATPTDDPRLQKCLRRVAATTGLSPEDEALRKVRCYEGTSGLAAECESDVSATMLLPSRSEQHYRHQCRLVSRG